MTDQELFNEVNEVLRTMPPRVTLGHDDQEIFAWLGRYSAVMHAWNQLDVQADIAISDFQSLNEFTHNRGYQRLMVLLYRARSDLIMKTGGPTQVEIAQGEVHKYFDHLRKIIEQAAVEIFFIDRYLDADFVSRYLPFVKRGVKIRLLARDGIPKLVPAVETFVQEHAATIEVRASQEIYQQFIFIDKTTCHTSGDSFKQGAEKNSTTLLEITGAFASSLNTYENLWANGKVVFPRPA